MKILLKALSGLIPTLKKQKAITSSIDTILSKRGESSKIEVIMVLFIKVLRLVFFIFIFVSILLGYVSLGDVIKALGFSKLGL